MEGKKFNSGCFVKGRKFTPEELLKHSEMMRKSWLTRADRHGMIGTRFHNTWRSMTTRCRGTCGGDSKRKYRDKGIRVCERWLKFKNFYEDMFPSYIDGLTIDRIDNKKGYFKENCRWATAEQQAENRSVSAMIEWQGEKMSLRNWARKLNVSVNGLRLRYHNRYQKGKITLDQLMTFKSKVPYEDIFY